MGSENRTGYGMLKMQKPSLEYGERKMKLTKKTSSQPRGYQCDICKKITNHINMYDDKYCYYCYEVGLKDLEEKGK